MPGKIGLLERSSANIHPTDHTSTETRGRCHNGILNSHTNTHTLTGLKVSLWIKHDLRSPVPTCSHILCEHTFVVMRWISYSCQSKVTDLNNTQKQQHLLNHTNIHSLSGVTFKSQVVLSKILEGFRSLCKTFAECMYFSPRRI